MNAFIASTCIHYSVVATLHCYYQAVTTDPGYVSDNWYSSSRFVNQLRELDEEEGRSQKEFSYSSSASIASLLATSLAQIGLSTTGPNSSQFDASRLRCLPYIREAPSLNITTTPPSRAPTLPIPTAANPTTDVTTPAGGWFLDLGNISGTGGQFGNRKGSNAEGCEAAIHSLQPHRLLFPSYCAICKMWRPERAAHSSLISKCILRYDHFCPWLQVPIGAFNYRMLHS